jgi:hypothetical protein
MENLTYFVSSRGILKSCSRHNTNPISSNDSIDLDLVSNLKPFESIYVCTDALFNFVNNFFQTITVPFILVTGDSDMPITKEFLNNSEIAKVLNSNLLLKWYAQNLNTQHYKLESIPIGLDYHTMSNSNNGWGLSAQSPIAQERALLDILAKSKVIKERFFSIYCNWHFQIERGNRSECFSQIDKTLCFFEKNQIPRYSTWLRQSEFMFVISPEGAGIDCHRTWEALLLGCIPIIKKNEHSKIFYDLPVLIVNDWKDIKSDLLLDTLKEFISKNFIYENLFMDFWKRKINNLNISPFQRISNFEFKRLFTQNSF